MKTSYVLKSKNIFDSISDVPLSGGVVVTGNKITGVFPEEQLSKYITDETQILDYGDKLILPGFIDSHMHVGVGMDYLDDTYCVDVGSTETFNDVVQLIQNFGERNPEANVLFGFNFNAAVLNPVVWPTRQLLDTYFPDRPVLIQGWELHTFYANSRAIELAGFTKDTPDPNHGIGKDKQGELTGVFNDTAAFAIQKIIQRSFAEKKYSLVNFMKILNKYGFTSVSDMYPCGTEKPYPLFKAMEKELTVRIHFYPELLSFKPENIDEYKSNYSGPMLKFSGLKNLMDGVPAQHTAWMTVPYDEDPSTCGGPSVSPEKVLEKVLEAASIGVNVRIHTIGDGAAHFILDVFEKARDKYGLLPRRNCMEHLDFILDDDIPRFKELNVVCAMQGLHIGFYLNENKSKYVMGLGQERIKKALRWRTVLNSGAVIANGSDYPVVSFNPALSIYTAVTRQTRNGYPEGGFLPEQRVTLAEILKSYTYGAAFALNREKELGTLEAGKLADITVLDRNLFAVSPKDYLDMMPVMTMVDGNIVFKK